MARDVISLKRAPSKEVIRHWGSHVHVGGGIGAKSEVWFGFGGGGGFVVPGEFVLEAF